MNYYVYILQSTQSGQFYIGQTQDLAKRFEEHNSGKSNYTSKHGPWILIWYVELSTRKEAYRLEQKIKGFKSRLRTIKFMEEHPVVSGSENPQISNLIDFRESS